MPFTGLKRLLCLLTGVCVRHSALSAPSALDGLVIRNEPGTWFSLEVCAVLGTFGMSIVL